MLTRSTVVPALLLAMLSACTIAPAAPNGPIDDSMKGEGDSPAGSKTGGSSGASDNRVDLGNQTAGSEITFEVPAGTIGFTIVVDATTTEDDFLGVQELRNPSGEAVVADFLDAREPGRMLTSESGVGMGVVRVPLVGDHAADAVPAGRWKVRLGGATRVADAPKGTTTPLGGRMHGVVLFQTTSDGEFHGGALDLDLYVPDGLMIDSDGEDRHSITAASARDDDALKTRIDITFDLVRRLYGLDRGDVRYHALPSSLRSVYGQEEVDAANVRANAVNPRPAAQIILTNELVPDGDGGSEINGIVNCLPGAVGIPGTKCSAVIVSLREGMPAWEDGTTLVHEVGHFVGLEHTTEFGGDGDTLADTPMCTDTAKSSLASCPDHDNLMFPTVNLATGESSIAVSSTQRALFRSSPLYRAAR